MLCTTHNENCDMHYLLCSKNTLRIETVHKIHRAPIRIKNLRCYQNAKTNLRLESIRKIHISKNLLEIHNTLRHQDFDIFSHMCRVYYSTWYIYRLDLYFSKSSCVGVPFQNALFQSTWISAPLTVRLFPQTEL